jgi:hypothetical protein
MEKQFVTYEITKDLKELGFDEPCLAYYDDEHLTILDSRFLSESEICSVRSSSWDDPRFIAAPLHQQVIDWFYNKGIIIEWNMSITSSWEYHICPAWPPMEKVIPMMIHSRYEYSTPNKARNEGIIETIELIKEYNNKNINEKF